MKNFRSALALTLSLLLVLTLLAGCDRFKPDGPDGDDVIDTPSGDDTPTPPPVEEKPDPYEVLSQAIPQTLSDVQARLDATPLPAVLALPDAPVLSSTFTVGFPDENGDVSETAAGSLVFDAVNMSVSADVTLNTSSLADLGVDSVDLPLRLYYGPDFMGIASPELFDSEIFYGAVPQNVAGQLSGTPIAKLLKLDETQLAQVDRALGEIGPLPDYTAPGLTDRFASLLLEFSKDRDATLTEDGDTANISVPLPAGDAQRLLTALADLLPQGVDRITVDLDGTLGQRLTALIGQAGDSTLAFTVKDGRVTELSITDTRPLLTLSLYGDTGTKLALTVRDLADLTLDTGDGLTLEASLGSETPTRTTLTWGEDGSFDFITYRADVTDLALQGTAKAEGGALAFDGIWYTGERGDRNPLTFTLTPGGSLNVPAETKNAGELTQGDIALLTLKLLSALNK